MIYAFTVDPGTFSCIFFKCWFIKGIFSPIVLREALGNTGVSFWNRICLLPERKKKGRLLWEERRKLFPHIKFLCSKHTYVTKRCGQKIFFNFLKGMWSLMKLYTEKSNINIILIPLICGAVHCIMRQGCCYLLCYLHDPKQIGHWQIVIL